MRADQHASALDRTLTDLIDLALLAKQAEWNLEGPLLLALRAELHVVAGLARRFGDAVATRAVTLGHHPDGRATAIARASVLPQLSAGPIRDLDAIEAFNSILESVVAHLHGAIDAFDGDPVSDALMTAIVGALEERAWVISAHGR